MVSIESLATLTGLNVRFRFLAISMFRIGYYYDFIVWWEADTFHAQSNRLLRPRFHPTKTMLRANWNLTYPLHYAMAARQAITSKEKPMPMYTRTPFRCHSTFASSKLFFSPFFISSNSQRGTKIDSSFFLKSFWFQMFFFLLSLARVCDLIKSNYKSQRLFCIWSIGKSNQI